MGTEATKTLEPRSISLPEARSPDWPDESDTASYGRVLQRLALALLVLGIVCRLVRYLLQFPIWGDEAMVLVNLLSRDYLGLTKQLTGAQVAPILFLWSEKTVFSLLGGSELAMRLLPFFAGVGALGLFWHLARRTVSPLAAAFAVGFLAVARWPVSMSTLAKPYSLDLFMALVLLMPAVHWLQRPERVRWLILLVVLVPIALMGSYPAAFVAGGVSLALLPEVWRREWWPTRVLFLAYNLLMAGTFLGCYLLVGREQLDPVAGSINAFLQVYWADGFPPEGLGPLARWLVLIHTGRLFAYPVGESNGGSTLTFLLCLAGIWWFWKAGQRRLLVLWLTPFALGLIAAFLRRYPYGGCCRISQHVAPAICLLAGAGAAEWVERLARSTSQRLRWASAVCGLLALCGLVGMVIDAVKPYRDQEALWTRKLVRDVRERVGPADRVVVLGTAEEVGPIFCWQLERLGGQLSWNGQVDWDRLEASGGRLWCVSARLGVATPPDDRLTACLAHRGGKWIVVDHVSQVVPASRTDDPTIYFDLFACTPTGNGIGQPRADRIHHPTE